MAIQISLVSNSGKEAVEKQKELECGDNETIEYKGHTINRAKIKEFDIFQYRKVEISEKRQKNCQNNSISCISLVEYVKNRIYEKEEVEDCLLVTAGKKG